MFKKGSKLILYVKENGDVTQYYNNTVIQYEEGLLKVRDMNNKELIYNVHSLNFIKAEIQD